MTLAAGNRLTAAQLARLQPTTYVATQTGNVGNQQTLTTSAVDSLNATVTFTTTTAAICVVQASFDFDVSAGGSAIALGNLVVDGATQNGEAHMNLNTTGTRHTVGQRWRFTLSGAGSHTVKLQVSKNAAAATAFADDNHTGFVLTVYEIP